MSDFAVQIQQQSRTIISSADLCAGSASAWFVWGTAASSVTWPVANQAMYVPILIFQPYLVQSMFIVNSSAVAGNIDLGIYTEGGVRLVSSGSTAQAGTNAAQSVDVTDTLLLPGVYYMAFAKDGTTGSMFAASQGANFQRGAGILSQASAFSLPDPATFVAAIGTAVPAFGIVGKATL